jgi:hypothetical protein
MATVGVELGPKGVEEVEESSGSRLSFPWRAVSPRASKARYTKKWAQFKQRWVGGGGGAGGG